MSYVGLDLSLTATGMAQFRGPGFDIQTLVTDKRRGFDRLQYIREKVRRFVTGQGDPALRARGVGIESYSMASKFNREAMGELGGIVRMMLWEEGIPFVDIAPTAVKKFITGKGSAGEKGLVMVEVFKRYGITVADNNQADAIVLAQIAEHHFETNYPPEFAYQKEVMAKLVTTPPQELIVRKRSKS